MSVQISIVGSNDRARLELVKALEGAPLDWDLRLCNRVPAEGIVVCDPGVDAPGAVVFDGSVDRLMQSVRDRTSVRPRVVAVTAASGGTGATSVALHLAAEFGARGYSTAAIDLGTRWGMRGRLGLEPAEPLHPVPVASGFSLVGDLDATEGFQRVVVDAAAERVGDFESATTCVIVFSPSPEGARRASALIDERPDLSWHLVTNRLGPGGETTRSQVERLVGRPVFELPCCPALRDSEDTGRLLARGWSRWSRSIARLAARLDG